MAAKTSFKQQCPSCENMVTIRDESLIGQKIDCPKCKYRFVVEEPAEEEEDFEEEDDGGKGKKSKAKGKKRARDDDEDRPRKKEGGSKKLVLGLAIGGAALVLLAVAAVLIIMNMGSTDKKPSTSGGATSGRVPGGAGNGAQNTPDDDAAPKKEEDKKPAVAKITSETATNLLPNDTEVVLNLMPQEILASPLGKTAFDTPGAFQKGQFHSAFGFPLDDLERVIVANNMSQNWSFTVVRTSKPVKQETVQKALHLKKAENSPPGFDYFTMAPNLDYYAKVTESLQREVTRALPQGAPIQWNDPNKGKVGGGARTMAVRFHDPQTIIVADLGPMKKFLAEKGQPATITKAAAPPKKEQATEGDEGSGGAGRMGMRGRMGGGPPEGAGGGPPGGMQDMMSRMGGRGRGAAATASDAPPPAASKSYLTIKTGLKAMMDRLEAKGPVLFSEAGDMTSAKEMFKGTVQGQFVNAEDIYPKFAGFSLGMKEKWTAIACAEFSEADKAKEAADQLSKALPGLAQLGPIIRMKIDVPGGTTGGGGMGGPGGFNPADMQRRMRGAMGAGADDENRGGRRGQPAGANPNQPPGGPPRFGAGGTGSQSEADNTIGSIKIEVGSHEKTLQLTAEIKLKQPAMEIAEKWMSEFWVRGRGAIATVPPTAHQLAAALVAYRDKNGSFPRGTFDRAIPSERQGREWPADQRISWMAELLPMLGFSEVHSKIDPQKSWRDDENLLSAMSLIPAFIDGRDPNRPRFIRYPNVHSDVAATDYVGMAGVGMDAASYDERKDPSVEKKVGIFGYDRVTKVEDIKDGLPNTIAVIQVPSAYKNPWLAGGGSTVRGCPETGSVKPFVSEQPDGKKGTIAIMANGDVRFIADNIPDDVFKAMCTIKGGEKADINKYTTLIPPPVEKDESETASEPSPTPPKEEKKEPTKKKEPAKTENKKEATETKKDSKKE
jgi:hypothetical protein